MSRVKSRTTSSYWVRSPSAAISFAVSGLLGAALLSALVSGCSSSKSSGFDDADGGSGNGGSGGGGGGSGLAGGGGGGTSDGGGGGVQGSSTTTVYAHTDDSLYTLDTKTNAVTLVGKFTGASGSITDLAVSAAGDVYVNTTTVIYKAQIPSSAGNVPVSKIATIAAKNGAAFYALAFAPAGVLGSAEALVGGDGNGELWSIDPVSGATTDLGSFGNDPSDSSKVLALSGDLVFYTDASNKPTGLATIRACTTGKNAECDRTNDFLAGVDMTALASAYTSGTPAASLLTGIYGGSSGKTGSGIGRGDVFGLGAWEGNVYGFSRDQTGVAPALLLIDTTTGHGSVLPATFTFTNGWSGAGVSTKTVVTIPPPSPIK